MQHDNIISFCTVCMNRLVHLKETLLKNIFDNIDYPALEFVLLDYNSSDGLRDWARIKLKSHMDHGLLKYYHTGEPAFFHRSHSRNLAFKLATGDIICNIDADNYTGKGFAAYLNEHFQKNKNSYLAVNFHDQDSRITDLMGRVACLKHDFEHVKGYDENMEGYGYEDIDFCSRLERSGLKACYIEKVEFLKVIKHTNMERIANERNPGVDTHIYIRYISPFESEILYCFPDQRFSFGTLYDHNEGLGNPTLKEGKWLKGTWKKEGNELLLAPGNSGSISFRIDLNGDLNRHSDRKYYSIHDEKFLRQLYMNYPIITNHQQYLNNYNSRKIRVNENSYGAGVVSMNFTRDTIKIT